MPVSQICLIVSLIFAIIFVFPRWAAPYEPYRWSAFALSWLFFIFWLVLGHGGINPHG